MDDFKNYKIYCKLFKLKPYKPESLKAYLSYIKDAFNQASLINRKC